jgi:predicted acyl esterase
MISRREFLEVAAKASVATAVLPGCAPHRPTSKVFPRGHRIRLEVSSSSYPRFDRNPNTGGVGATETCIKSALQSVSHGAGTPSRVILPIIPH